MLRGSPTQLKHPGVLLNVGPPRPASHAIKKKRRSACGIRRDAGRAALAPQRPARATTRVTTHDATP